MVVQTKQSYLRLHESSMPSDQTLFEKKERPGIVCFIYLCIIASVGFLVLIIGLYKVNKLKFNEVTQPFPLHKSIFRAHAYSVLSNGEFKDPLPHRPAQKHPHDVGEVIVSCYYNTPTSPSSSVSQQLMPDNIHPNLCTHINVAFACVVNKEIYLDNSQYQILKEIVALKAQNPQLHVLVSVGGAGNDNGFSDMVVNHASRKIFIKSIKNLLKNYTLDGIDLDWEFPALQSVEGKSLGHRERQHFSQLLREIRMEYIREKREYLLTVAVPAPETIVDVSYDVDQLNLYVDYVNLMTYDFHYYTKYTPFTGFNSPLYSRPSEHLYLATLNINYTIHMYMSKGLDRSKIVVGIPTYGHTFKLVNPNNPNVGSPASGFGSLGGFGFVNYPDVCKFLKNSGHEARVVFDNATRVPYLYKQSEWVSYDTPRSVMEKANYIKANGLRGAMIYSLNADDFEGVCQEGHNLQGDVRFPLAQSVKSILICNSSCLMDTKHRSSIAESSPTPIKLR